MSDKRGSRLKKKSGKGRGRIAQPKTKDSIPAEQQPPVFSLQYLQSDYCITQCEGDDQAQFSVKLRKLSELTWSMIQSVHRHGLGYERIEQDAIKAPVPPHITADVNLIAFRFSGMKSMVGYRDGRIFYVVWLDRDFTLYPH
ncbi:MAG: hypothetical protein WBA76_18065 [Phormidesmis sp.]